MCGVLPSPLPPPPTPHPHRPFHAYPSTFISPFPLCGVTNSLDILVQLYWLLCVEHSLLPPLQRPAPPHPFPAYPSAFMPPFPVIICSKVSNDDFVILSDVLHLCAVLCCMCRPASCNDLCTFGGVCVPCTQALAM